VLTQEDSSLGNAVRKVVQHAKETGASLIAVSTHARKGATRFLLGSFAETLILHSEIPTLLVSPKARPQTQINNLLFPTDLSAASLGAFQNVVELAKEVGAKLTIFHRLDMFSSAVKTRPEQDPKRRNVFEEEMGRREREADKFTSLAKANDVPVELLLQNIGADTTDAILNLSAELPACVIAMVSQTGPVISSVVLGSITRRVIWHATCPVWVVHPTK